jgi:Endonuclease/Exonuclease/phosphatase family
VVKGDLVGDTVYILVNHWPSRRGGSNAADLANKEAAYNSNNTFRERQNELSLRNNSGLRSDGEELSRPARMAAARECMSVVDSIYMQNPLARIMIMGDLNDDPVSPSIVNGIKAKDDIAKVQPKEIYNPFTEYLKKGYGTLVFGGKWNLFDQVMFSHAWLNQQQLNGWFLYKSHIYYRDFLIEQKGDYKGYPKRSWVGNRWNDGYSDHLPVYTVLLKALPQ